MPSADHGTTAVRHGMPPGRLPEPVPAPEPVSESRAHAHAVGNASGETPVDNPEPPTTATLATETSAPVLTARAPPDPPQRVFEHFPALDGPIAEFQAWWRDLTGHLGPTNPLAFTPFWAGVRDDPTVKPVWDAACRDFAMAVISAVSASPNDFSLHRFRNYVNHAVSTAARTSGRAWQGASAVSTPPSPHEGRWKDVRLAAANAIRDAKRVFGNGAIPKNEIARIARVMRDKYGRITMAGTSRDAVSTGIEWALNENPKVTTP